MNVAFCVSKKLLERKRDLSVSFSFVSLIWGFAFTEESFERERERAKVNFFSKSTSREFFFKCTRIPKRGSISSFITRRSSLKNTNKKKRNFSAHRKGGRTKDTCSPHF